MSHDTTAADTSPLAFVPRRRVVAAIADDAVESVTDLRPRGRAEEIEAALRETHLPALEEAGYIEWDPETGEIEPGPNFSEAADHVADLPIHDPESADD
ncbi:DUF7344 domain-containing protein [Halorubrum cibi]|uniref:DUF7344 domain-containing protein n=1 Tax=Halorubrum cibi TaxID=413815 RepID=A0A521BDA9_9EURY|nr:hypothetical protein [Halorubrum cibi]SMO45084.1 hypothetical protein SAMN06264867_102200 [Halorubrum cibi]